MRFIPTCAGFTITIEYTFNGDRGLGRVGGPLQLPAVPAPAAFPPVPPDHHRALSTPRAAHGHPPFQTEGRIVPDRDPSQTYPAAIIAHLQRQFQHQQLLKGRSMKCRTKGEKLPPKRSPLLTGFTPHSWRSVGKGKTRKPLRHNGFRRSKRPKSWKAGWERPYFLATRSFLFHQIGPKSS